MSDKEKIEEIYAFVKAQEDYHYERIAKGEYEIGTVAHWHCLLQATAFQKVRYFIENLMEESEK